MSDVIMDNNQEIDQAIERYIPLTQQRHPFTSSIEQRSVEWFALRKGRLSGSVCSSLLFIKTKEDLQLEYDRIFNNGPPKTFTEEVKKLMEFGTIHEMSAIKTLLQHFKHVKVFECGLKPSDKIPFLAASPDGVIQDTITGNYCAFEIKCPNGKRYRRRDGLTKPYDKIPYYYVLQLYLEMFCLNMKKCLFMCWSQTGSKIWVVDFDQVLWEEILQFLQAFKDNTCEFSEFKDKQLHLKLISLPKFVKRYSQSIDI